MPDTGNKQAEATATAKRSTAYLIKSVSYKNFTASPSWHGFRLGGGEASIG
jgi:hypothetical protein